MNNNNELTEKIEYLKKKCNAQLEHITRLTQENKGLREQAESYQLQMRKLLEVDHVEADNASMSVDNRENNNKLLEICVKFSKVITPIIQNNFIIKSKKMTELSQKYVVIRKIIFLEYLEKELSLVESSSEAKALFQKWAELGLVASADSKKIFAGYTQAGASIQIVRINRHVWDMLQDGDELC